MSVYLQPKSFCDVCSAVTVLDLGTHKTCMFFDPKTHVVYNLATRRDINKLKKFKSYDTAINYLVKLGFTDITVQPFIEFSVPDDDDYDDDVDCVLITN